MSAYPLPATELFTQIKKLIGDSSNRPVAVCFDFFDTLINRSIPAEHTKMLAARKLSELSGTGLHADELYQLRSILEERLCRSNRAAGNDAEFNLLALAQALYDSLLRTGSLEKQGDVNDFLAAFVAIEVAVEKEVQRTNKDLIDVLIYCKEKGLITAIVSDFYLPEPYFSELVRHHDLGDKVDHVIVSADYLVTKGYSGRLYQTAAKKIGCTPDQMVMIGDNPIADENQARALGLQPYLVARNAPSLSVKKSKYEQFNKLLKTNNAPFFKEMGVSLHWFTRRLFLTALADGCEDLFFCSKEGEFLRKLFLSYQQVKFGKEVIHSHYLYVSRKSTFICSLKPLEQETFSRLFNHYRDLSLSEFLRSLNFSESEAEQICRELQKDYGTRHYDLRNHDDFKSLVQTQMFKERYEVLRQEQRKNFITYLSHFNLDFKKQGIALVDVGWKGSIQNNIYYAFDEKIEVQGYYLGLLSPTEVSKKNQKTGILFHDVPYHSDYIHVFNNNRSLIEMLLGASHGSADGYYAKEEKERDNRKHKLSFVAVSDDPDIPLVALVDLPEERELYATAIQPLQQAYESLHEEFTVLSRDSEISIPDLEWVARKHARMVFRPRSAEIDLFSKLYHLENFGLFEFTGFDSPRHISFFQKMKNLWALKKNPEAYLETGIWPPIVLRRLGLGSLTPLDGKKRFNRIFGSSK